MKGFAACLVAVNLAAAATASFCAEPGSAQNSDPKTHFFERLHREKSEFNKLQYLISDEVQDNPAIRDMAGQMLATSYSFLGRPNDALRAYPAGAAMPLQDIPGKRGYGAIAADEWIAEQAKNFRVVMVNEAHHAPQTRLLILSLLPKLRNEGYTHFAVETLINDGTEPVPSGYPTEHTGFYTREPIFGEIIREALRLGYVLVPYEAMGDAQQTQQQRETGQAENIATRIVKDPKTKILVHAGYGHISEAPKGMPDSARPMAMEFERITSLSVLSVDQTSLQPYFPGAGKTGHDRLNAEFAIARPSVLLNTKDRRVWSTDTERFDATVVLPKSPENELRPAWLSIDGKRTATSVDMSACLRHLPCLVEARYADEGDDAIPADQFVMIKAGEVGTPLFLSPGKYRVRLLGNGGNAISSSSLDVSPPQATDPAKVSKIVPQSTASAR